MNNQLASRAIFYTDAHWSGLFVPLKSGIYEIFNTVNGKQYIGGAANLSQRFAKHIKDLNEENHHNIHLQRAWAKYGESAFVFSVIEYVSKESLLEREQFWMDAYGVVESGYNINPVAGSRLGGKMPEHQKQRLRELFKGKPLSPEHRKKISEAAKGRGCSEETKRKLSKIFKGGHHTPEARKKISEAQIGVKNPKVSKKLREFWANPENKEKRVAQLRGLRESWADPEKRKARIKKVKATWKKKRKMGLPKRKVSQETRRKLSKVNKGRKMSPEHCKKISERQKLWWAKKREKESENNE